MITEKTLTENTIHPTALVSVHATMGRGNIVRAYAVIHENVILGDNNYVGEHTTIGTPGEYRNKGGITFDEGILCVFSNGNKIIIGDRNVIRELVAIQSPVIDPETHIGNDCYIMEKTHIAHDCRVGDHVTIAPLTTLGGRVHLGSHVNCGQGVGIHPRIKIGEGAMLGLNATITKDVMPWSTIVGVNRFIKINTHGMIKAGHTTKQISEWMEANAHTYPPCAR